MRTIKLALVLLLSIAIASCGGGGGGGSTTTTGNNNTSNTVAITGSMDNSTVVLASQEGLLERFLAMFSPAKKAYAAVGVPVNNIIAVSPDGALVEAVKSGSSFSLQLNKGKPYVLALLNNATVLGLYKADATTGMDAFPITSSTMNIDLGTVSLLAGTATGTIPSSSLLNSLGLNQSIATAFGAMSKGMARFANMDVDGNGVIDKKDNKYYNLKIGFDFLSTPFASLNGAWSMKEDAQLWFYGFNYLSCPDDTALDWANAGLTSPQGFQICNAGPPICNNSAATTVNNDIPTVADTIAANAQTCRHMNFYGGSKAIISPVPPPAGTYTISVPNIAGTGTQTLTFRNVATPDMTNMQNIYIPEIKLTKDINGMITLLEWRWWRKTGTTWTQPTDAELAIVMDWANFTISGPVWSGSRVTGSMAITQSGSIVPPAQTGTPGVIMIGVGDKSQYDYAFEFR